MHDVEDLLRRRDGAEQLVRGGEGDEAGGAIDKLRELVRRQLPGPQVRLGPPHLRVDAAERAGEHRRIQPGQHHRGIGPQQRRDDLGERLVQRGQARAEHDAIRTCADEIGHGDARAVDQVVALEAAGLRARGMRTGGDVEARDGGGHAE